MSHTCPECGRRSNDTGTYCPHCGRPKQESAMGRLVRAIMAVRPKRATGFYVTSTGVTWGYRTNRRKAPKNFVFFAFLLLFLSGCGLWLECASPTEPCEERTSELPGWNGARIITVIPDTTVADTIIITIPNPNGG